MLPIHPAHLVTYSPIHLFTHMLTIHPAHQSHNLFSPQQSQWAWKSSLRRTGEETGAEIKQLNTATHRIFPSASPVGLEKQSKRDRGGDRRGDKIVKQASNNTTQLIPTSGAWDNALVPAKWTSFL